MPDNPRIEDLRRRVQADPTSIAFAQLAEEYRRAGQYTEAVQVCRAGLAVHPGYLSARVTLGRALLELGQLDDALSELELVLKSAPENLAAIRGLAEILHRRGALVEALAQYRSALSLAKNDPDLEETVNDLARQLTPQKGPEPSDGLSFEQLRQELAVSYVPPPPRPSGAPARSLRPLAPQHAAASASRAAAAAQRPADESAAPPLVATPPSPPPAPRASTQADVERDRAARTIAVLEQWLAAIHVARAEQHP